MIIIGVMININYTRSSEQKEIVIEHELTEAEIFEMQNTIRP